MAKPTNAELERVAKAIYAAFLRYWKSKRVRWVNADGWRRDEMLALAEAAITASRKPRRRQGE
jgi:hypothetical protein